MTTEPTLLMTQARQIAEERILANKLRKEITQLRRVVKAAKSLLRCTDERVSPTILFGVLDELRKSIAAVTS